jgi:hypothetical protein
MRARASSPDDGADESFGRDLCTSFLGEPEPHSGVAGHVPGAAGGLGRADGTEDRGVSTILPGEHGDGQIQDWHRDRVY